MKKSYGTLGIVTSISLTMVEYKPYIHLTYQACYSLDDTVELLDNETHKKTSNDSVEGIAFSKDTAVIMTGQFVTIEEVKIGHLSVIELMFLKCRLKGER